MASSCSEKMIGACLAANFLVIGYVIKSDTNYASLLLVDGNVVYRINVFYSVMHAI